MVFVITRDIDPIVKSFGDWLSGINVYSIIVRIFLAVFLCCIAIIFALFILPRIESIINNKTPYLTLLIEFNKTDNDHLKELMKINIYLKNHKMK